MRLTVYAIGAVVALTFLAGFDKWSLWFLDGNPGLKAFVLSDGFWPVLIGGTLLAGAVAGIGALIFIASTPPPRVASETPVSNPHHSQGTTDL